jgi:hypothetical protein
MRCTVDTAVEDEGIADPESESAKSDRRRNYPKGSLLDERGEIVYSPFPERREP